MPSSTALLPDNVCQFSTNAKFAVKRSHNGFPPIVKGLLTTVRIAVLPFLLPRSARTVCSRREREPPVCCILNKQCPPYSSSRQNSASKDTKVSKIVGKPAHSRISPSTLPSSAHCNQLARGNRNDSKLIQA